MGIRGKKPAPYSVIKSHGGLERNPGRYKRLAGTPKNSAPISKPRDLKGDAGKAFQQTVDVLKELEVLDRADVFMVRSFAEAWVAYRSAEQEGDVRLAIRLRDQLLKYFGDLGLNPVSRTRLASIKPEEDNPLAQLRTLRDSKQA